MPKDAVWLVMNDDRSCHIVSAANIPVINKIGGWYDPSNSKCWRGLIFKPYCKNWKKSLRKIVDKPSRKSLLKKIANQRMALNDFNKRFENLKPIKELKFSDLKAGDVFTMKTEYCSHTCFYTANDNCWILSKNKYLNIGDGWDNLKEYHNDNPKSKLKLTKIHGKLSDLIDIDKLLEQSE